MTVVSLVEAVVRREVEATRTLSLGVVTEVFSNEGGGGDHHLDANVRLHGGDMVLQHVPIAVARIGLSALPRAGDLVVVGFIDGDIHGPLVLGVLHDADTPSPDAATDELVYEVPDSDGDRRAAIMLPNGNSVVVRDGDVTVTMGSTNLVIEADGNITLEAAGDIVMKANGSLTLEAAGSATLKGATVEVEGSGSAKLKGATTTVAGMTSFSAS